MITFENFLWLIHFLLIGLYIFTIGQYLISRAKNPEIYNALADIAPGAQMKYWDSMSNGFVSVAFAHVAIFGTVMQSVPLFLICMIIITAIADVKYEIAKPYIKAHRQSERDDAIREELRRRRAAQDGRSQSDFDFNEKAWKEGGTGKQNTSRDQSPPDYQSALRDALQEASKISDARAEKFAKVWAKLAAEPGLDPKIKLFRELVSMLLAERAKGFKGRSDQSEPTQDEVAKLIAARPGR